MTSLCEHFRLDFEPRPEPVDAQSPVLPVDPPCNPTGFHDEKVVSAFTDRQQIFLSELLCDSSNFVHSFSSCARGFSLSASVFTGIVSQSCHVDVGKGVTWGVRLEVLLRFARPVCQRKAWLPA